LISAATNSGMLIDTAVMDSAQNRQKQDVFAGGSTDGFTAFLERVHQCCPDQLLNSDNQLALRSRRKISARNPSQSTEPKNNRNAKIMMTNGVAIDGSMADSPIRESVCP